MSDQAAQPQPKPKSAGNVDNDTAVGNNNIQPNNGVQIAATPANHFGMRPAIQNQTTPRATGSRLKPFEKFLVKLEFTSVLPLAPGLPATSKLIGAKVMEKTGGAKLEPHIVYGSLVRDIKGFNQQFIPESKTPIQLWFPKGLVNENDKIKATQEELLRNGKAGLFREIFYFFEYKGGETLAEQIRKCKEEYEYKIPE